jgi:ribosomal protein L18
VAQKAVVAKTTKPAEVKKPLSKAAAAKLAAAAAAQAAKPRAPKPKEDQASVEERRTDRRPPATHGTVRMANEGCRCDLCRTALSDYRRERATADW